MRDIRVGVLGDVLQEENVGKDTFLPTSCFISFLGHVNSRVQQTTVATTLAAEMAKLRLKGQGFRTYGNRLLLRPTDRLGQGQEGTLHSYSENERRCFIAYINEWLSSGADLAELSQ
jgi:hypothetical protein